MKAELKPEELKPLTLQEAKDQVKSLTEINEMFSRLDQLTDDERKQLRHAIIQNDEARAIAISGAIKLNNYSLAWQLSLMNCA